MLSLIRIRSGLILLVVVSIFLLSLNTSVPAQSSQPRFNAYPVRSVFKGKNAAIRLSKEDMNFRTRLRHAARQKPDFAGEYVLAAWGCGAECLVGAAVNVRTGRVYWLPFTICCWAFGDDVKPIDHRLNSRLTVFSGSRNESEKDTRDDMHYYEFQNGRFIFLKTLKRRETN